MKTAKKALLLALCAVLLVVATVMGTLAYLKSTTQVVTNTMTAGKVAITLDEAKVTEYGVKVGDTRVTDGNTYKLIAGHTYVKDPTVTVAADSEKSYVRVVVTISDIADLKKACGDEDASDPFYPHMFVQGWYEEEWHFVAQKEEDNVATYVFEYADIVETIDDDDALVLPALFDTFTMPETATNNQINALEGMNITVQAYACQADGFDNGTDAMSASFEGFVGTSYIANP